MKAFTLWTAHYGQNRLTLTDDNSGYHSLHDGNKFIALIYHSVNGWTDPWFAIYWGHRIPRTRDPMWLHYFPDKK